MEQFTQNGQTSPLEGIRVVGERGKGILDAYVPLELITSEDVPVDPNHVQSLKADILREQQQAGRKYGQLIAVSLAEIPGVDKFPPMDGFHRLAALSELGEKEAFATVQLGCTWEHVIDQRILAAALHRSVKFARVVEWIDDAWQCTPWSKEPLALRVGQAFALTSSTTMTGTRLGLTDEEEAQQVKAWVQSKCQMWQITPNSVYQQLVATEGADPDLIKRVQEKGASGGEAVLGPTHLKAIAHHLPMQYKQQRLVAEAVLEHGLTAKQANLLAKAVSYTRAMREATSMVKYRLPAILEETSRFARGHQVATPRITYENRTYLENARLRLSKFEAYLAEARTTAGVTGQTVSDIISGDYFDITGEDLTSQSNQKGESEKETVSRQLSDGSILSLDFARGTIKFIGVNGSLEEDFVHLTPAERRMLAALMRASNGKLTKDRLAIQVFGKEILETGYEHLLRVNIARLREKLGDDGRERKVIETITSWGYGLFIDKSSEKEEA